MKKVLLLLLTLTLAFTSALFVTSCKDEGGSKGHKHSYSSSHFDPTCEEQGGTKYVCSCGDEYWEDTVPELGHNPSSEWTIDKQATCTQTGLKSHHCLTCKKHLDETAIALLPHSIDDGVCTVCKNSFYAQGLTYALNNTETEYSVTGIGSYSGSDLYIPQTYNDLPVTGIAAYAFSQQTQLKSVNIPKNIKSIGDYAFNGCVNITRIEFDASSCSDFEENNNVFSYVGQSQNGTTVAIGKNVARIPSYFLYSSTKTNNAPKIKEINFDNASSLKTINEYAFAGCTALKSITVPNKVTLIRHGVFYGCSYLQDITLPFIGQQKTFSAYDNPIYKTIYYVFSPIIFNGATLTGGYGAEYMPSSLKTVIVTDYEPGASAFSDCTKLESVTIKTASKVNDNLFYNCTSLTSVTLPDGITEIGKNAFYGCKKLETFTFTEKLTIIKDSAFYNCSLANLSFNDKLEEIGANAFYGCKKITTLVFPTELKTIKNGAFAECSALASLSFNDKIEEIASFAFGNCTSLKEITLPSSLTKIGAETFKGCLYIEKITLPFIGTEKTLTNSYGDKNLFGYIFSYSNVEYDATKTDESYYHTYKITQEYSEDGSSEFWIPKTLKIIIFNGSELNYGAFSGLSNTTTITLGGNLTTINSYAFKNCSSVIAWENATITTFGDYSFNYYQGKNISIPASVTNISNYAFLYCENLLSFFVSDNNEKYTSIDGNLYNKDGTTLIRYATGKPSTDFTTPTNISSIANNAFHGCTSLTSITINNSVTNIGDYYVLTNCTSLTSITIGNGVTALPEKLLKDCSSIEEITIPFVGARLNGTSYTHFGYIFGASSYSKNSSYVPSSLIKVTVTGGNILSSAFSGCSSLTSINISDSVTSIGSSAFSGCSSLEEITIPFIGAVAGKTSSDTYQYPFGYIFGTSSYTGGVATKQYYYGSSTSSTTYSTYYIHSSLKKVTVTGGNILYGGFYDCSNITTIVLGDNITSIGSSVFRSCSSLTSITIPDNVTSIGKSAFYDCYKLVEVINKSSLDITAGSEDYGYVGYYAICVHNGNSLVKTVDDYQFITYDNVNYLLRYLGNDTEITLPSNYNGEKYQIYNYAFYNNTKLTRVTIPDSVTSIGTYAFYNCSSLTSVTIGNKVTSIDDMAFYGCTKLTSVTFENTSGWYITEDSTATSGTNVDVTTPLSKRNLFKINLL